MNIDTVKNIWVSINALCANLLQVISGLVRANMIAKHRAKQGNLEVQTGVVTLKSAK